MNRLLAALELGHRETHARELRVVTEPKLADDPPHISRHGRGRSRDADLESVAIVRIEPGTGELFAEQGFDAVFDARGAILQSQAARRGPPPRRPGRRGKPPAANTQIASNALQKRAWESRCLRHDSTDEISTAGGSRLPRHRRDKAMSCLSRGFPARDIACRHCATYLYRCRARRGALKLSRVFLVQSGGQHGKCITLARPGSRSVSRVIRAATLRADVQLRRSAAEVTLLL